MSRLLDALAPLPDQLKFPLLTAFEIIRDELAQTATKTDVMELREAIRQLTEAQERTEQRVAELADAQKQTDQRFAEMAEAHKQMEQTLAESGKQTDLRFAEMAESHKQMERTLAESGRQTDLRLAQLAEAQRRTEQEVASLARSVERLSEGQKRMREHLGTLTHTVGYRLEDEACSKLPRVLKRDFGVDLRETLDRRFLESRQHGLIEVNIWAEGRRDGRECVVIGEAKSQLRIRDIDRFVKKCAAVETQAVGKEQIRILVTYFYTPEVKAHAEEAGVALYLSRHLEAAEASRA